MKKKSGFYTVLTKKYLDLTVIEELAIYIIDEI